MLREETMLCFGTVTEPSRFSTSMQSIPRSPSSQASPSPTGPPPAISTEVVASLILVRLAFCRPRYLPVVPAKAGTHTPCRRDVAPSCVACNAGGGYGSPLSRGRQRRGCALHSLHVRPWQGPQLARLLIAGRVDENALIDAGKPTTMPRPPGRMPCNPHA